MGWLDHWRQNSEVSQPDLLTGEITPVPSKDGRYTGVTANKRLKDELKARGAEKQTYREVNTIVTQGMLGCSPRELDEATGYDSDRSKLPADAQEALTVGDIAARRRIEDNDAQGPSQLKQSASEGISEVRGLFSWNRKGKGR
ncbi:hypothetical protein ACQ4M4_28260 [Leptolyngbya sp. AN02str]|uniref:hypothetical protein n=1 Tax=Leptolyngbya sp. AN02str TaxID=3423363 RepID=UPI003D317E85